MSLTRGVELKLARADEHMDALDDAIEGFLDAKPYAATAAMECDGTELVVRWERYADPSERLGLIVGDAVHNLRAALDHMAMALSKAGATSEGATMTREDEAGIQFPIVLSHEQFVNQVNRGRLVHVEPDAQAVIESRQPYRTHRPRDAPLFLVADLDNADKHRQLPLAGLATSVVTVSWPMALQGTDFQRPAVPAGHEPGTEIGRFVFADSQREVDVPIEVRWGFTLWTGYWPYLDIRYMIDTYRQVVRATIDELSRFVR